MDCGGAEGAGEISGVMWLWCGIAGINVDHYRTDIKVYNTQNAFLTSHFCRVCNKESFRRRLIFF